MARVENIEATPAGGPIGGQLSNPNAQQTGVSVGGVTQTRTGDDGTGTNKPKIVLDFNQATTYEIGGSGLEVRFTKNQATTKIKLFTSTNTIIFTNIGNSIVIPDNLITNVGQYKFFLLPYNDTVDGDVVEFNLNAIQRVSVGVPEIFNIAYPQVLQAPDFVGNDVSFEIKWESVNTDWVKVYFGNDKSSFVKVNKDGVQKFNVKEILDKNPDIERNTPSFPIPITLVGVNESGIQKVEGRDEIVVVEYRKSRFNIPRNLAINRLVEGFAKQFDYSTFEDTSRYLTHLLHFGNGDNKVITTWTGSENSLILKLYEPLPTAVQPNDLVWISKLQSSPIIETVTIVGIEDDYCPPLKGPNFALEPDNGIGFEMYDDLIASGSATSTDLLNNYANSLGIDTINLNIQYASGSEIVYSNFVNFGSAAERVENFVYKLKVIENYTTINEDLQTNSDWTGSVVTLNQINTNLQKIAEVKKGFDGFENWLYTDTDFSSSLSYPKSGSVVFHTTSSLAVDWYENTKNSAITFDNFNPNYLNNNLPAHIIENSENTDFLLFMDMIGQHFDIVWTYIKSVGKLKVLEEKQTNGLANNMVFHLLKSLGWDAKKSFDSRFLWEYAFGLNKDGSQKYEKPLKSANEELWRRILNNLPYLLKNKGTKRSVQAIMACYGVPQSMLTIMEFGGPKEPTQDGTVKFTFDDFTSAIKLRNFSEIEVPWKQIPTLGHYPNAVEIRFKPDRIENTTLLTIGGFQFNINSTGGQKGIFDFSIQGSVEPYFSTTDVYYPYIDPLDIDLNGDPYAEPPLSSVSSSDYVISTEHWTNLLINKHDIGAAAWYEIRLQTTDGNRILLDVSSSIVTSPSEWSTGSLVIGGDFSGSVDELRLWRVPLEISKFQNHTLFPDAINGNSYTASTADLMFRLDFEYPKDRTIDDAIKNVAISTLYGENFATASGFYSASAYPYQYIGYERVVTANVPSTGYSLGNKVRFETQELVTDLSYKQRATKKSLDQAPIDSNQIGIFFSPIKELNMDIVKSFGDFNIDNYIGNPADEYADEYTELKVVRDYYFERLNRNLNEYIQLVKYIDKSLFDTIADLVPARAKLSKGLLIEPHYLERSKTKWSKPLAEYGTYQSSVDVDENIELSGDSLFREAEITEGLTTNFDVDYTVYNAEIAEISEDNISAEKADYLAIVNGLETEEIVVDYANYEGEVDAKLDGAYLDAELDAQNFTQVGMDPFTISNLGFGLWQEEGLGSIYKRYDSVGNYTQSRVEVYLVEEEFEKSVLTKYEVNTTGTYLRVSGSEFKVRIQPIGTPPTLSGNVLSATPLTGSFRTHYRYTNNLFEGLQQSFFKGSVQTSATTPDGLPPVETFTTNPNILRVASTGRGSGEPILQVD